MGFNHMFAHIYVAKARNLTNYYPGAKASGN